MAKLTTVETTFSPPDWLRWSLGQLGSPWPARLAGLALLLAGLALGLTLAYRTAAPTFALDIGSKDADPFIAGFHQAERAPVGDLTYRWTRAASTVTVPGYGRRDAVLTLDLAGTGRQDASPPVVTVLVGGQEVARLSTTTSVQAYMVPVSAALIHGGDVVVELRTETFQPPRDARRLGVLVDAVALAPAPGSSPALPPWRLLLLAALAVTITGLVGAAALARPLPGLAPAVVVAAAIIFLCVTDRYTLTLWLREGAPQAVVSGLCALLGLAATHWWLRRQRGAGEQGPGAGDQASGGRSSPYASGVAAYQMPGSIAADQTPSVAAARPTPDPWSLTTRATGWLWLLLWAVALAYLLGVAHPQFKSSDLTMNVHRLEDVARGQWLLKMDLPGESALSAPYPPAYYAMLLPLLPLAGGAEALKQHLITFSATGLLTMLAAIAFVVGARVGGVAAGLWAALLHGFAPVGFLLVSQGNFANIFGQWAAGLVFLLLATLPDWRRPAAGLAIVAALLLAFLGHFGVFLTLLLAVPVMALTVWPPPIDRPDQTGTLLRLFALALFLAFLIYYRHYLDLIVDDAQRILATRGASGEALGWNAGVVAEWGRTRQALGWLGLPLAAAGAVGLWRTGRRAGRLTVGWLAAGAVFAAAGIVVGLSVRYHFFALLGLAVAGGWLLARISERGRPGALLAGLLALAWVGSGLTFWYTRVLTYLH